MLITGVAGFIGSNVAIHLVKKYPEYQFIGIDKLSYCSSLKSIEEIMSAPNFRFIKLDITNLEFTNYIMQRYKIHTVLHFAAYTHVDRSFGNSLKFTHNNILGTHSLLEAAKNNKISKFIHVSTDEVYGSKDETSSEKALLDPTNPYAATKAAAEHLVRSYYYSFGLPYIITRGNNVYGPLQYPEKVIPKFICRMFRGLPCIIQGSGRQVRSFLYVTDVCEAFDVILHHGKVATTYNIGSSDSISVKDLAQTLIDSLGGKAKFGPDRDFNDERYDISCSKLKELGWSQKVGLSEGLAKTIEWYRNNPAHWDEPSMAAALSL